MKRAGQAPQATPAACDNLMLRRLLQRAGLKCSLPRLKIIGALLRGGRMHLGDLHARLVAADVPIALLCLRQSLHRLQESGLVLRGNDQMYALALDASVVEDQPVQHDSTLRTLRPRYPVGMGARVSR